MLTRLCWAAAALVTMARAAAAFSLPLTGDEAYYWEWSRRPAAGYTDHPPGVAWTIAAFAHLGHGAGFVRLGFVLSGVVATLAVAACATLLTRDRRAGAVAALAMSLAPLFSFAFIVATPDGPFLAFWCCAVLLALRLARGGGLATAALLGVALGGTVLSRFFGFALVAGLACYALTPEGRRLWRRGLWLAFAIAAVAYAPFVAWNAAHGWVTFAFTFVHRHEGEGGAGFSVTRVVTFCLTQAAAYSPGLWAAAVWNAVRPRDALVAWTALPMFWFLAAFALVRQVEANWTLGAFASLCVLVGMAYPALRPASRRAWAALVGAPAALLLVTAFSAILWPGQVYAAVQSATRLRLSNAGPFETFAFRPLALDVARIAQTTGSVVATDGYGLSSVMDFEAGVPPVVIGYDWQGRESHAWYPTTMHPRRLLFVDKEPLGTRPDFALHLARACGTVRDGGARAYRFGGAPARTFYFTWCEAPRPDALAILRWEREPT